ncbi:MAG: hypothetical protein M3P30_04525 [Chloroflexota bacterium]|nr:hypothetical protein [Chloroflexota bacterium]
MEAPEERLARQYLKYLFNEYPGSRHIQRLAASVGPAIWKISQAIGHAPKLSSTRQLRFSYKGRSFKGRYSHHDGGKLELVEVLGTSDGTVVATIRGLNDAMTLDLKKALDKYIG